jgi:SAM-dependent methyltransferase
MSDWSQGYVTDIAYTYGYYPELNPLRMSLALLESSWAVPSVATACELGFGQGLSINIHAAATGVDWYGTDINPSQVNFAQNLAGSSARINLFEDSFAEFSARADLPDFDFIGLHGIWSWIDDANRALIVDFLRRKLKVGGVLYISYNTMPGWATMVPLRDLLTAHSEVMSVPGQGLVSRIDQALEFVGKLMATNPLFATANPNIVKRVEALRGQDRNYLAHEYFNRDWAPMSFARMAEWLAPAKLSFACSAQYHDLVDTVNLQPAQQQIITEIPDPIFRQTVRDFMTNQQFRKDYWIKGPRKLSQLEQHEALMAHPVVLATPREAVPLKFAGAVGEVAMQEAVFGPILNQLADHRAKTLGQVAQAVAGAGINFMQVREAALLLTGTGHLHPAQPKKDADKAQRQTQELNAQLCEKARAGIPVSTLATPLTGGGISLNRFSLLFLQAYGKGQKSREDWVQHVWQILSAQGQSLVREGKTLMTAEENLAELASQAEKFELETLPILRAAGII